MAEYQLDQLIDRAPFCRFPEENPRVHLICDIDKTYLETEFETVFQILKIALERASEKRTVAGAPEVLKRYRWSEARPRKLHFVSSSPQQLRAVLRDKLTMDGLDWDSDTFKNQSYNLLKGRMDLLRNHIAYKAGAILDIAGEARPDSQFYFIGDNAESDAFVYVGVAMLFAEILDAADFCDYLRPAVEDGEILKSLRKRAEALRGGKIHCGGVLIRRAPGYDFVDAPPLSELSYRFEDFLEAALIFIHLGLIPESELTDIAKYFHNKMAFPKWDIVGKVAGFCSSKLASSMKTDCLDRLVQDLRTGQNPELKIFKPYEPSVNLSEMSLLDKSTILDAAGTWVRSFRRSSAKNG